MAYSDVLTGLAEVIGAVTGIAKVIAFEPTSIQAFPTAHIYLEEGTYQKQSQVNIYKYTITCRVYFRWQDPPRAELELAPFVNSIPAAIAADPDLGGHITGGMATVSAFRGDWWKVGDTDHRILEFTIDVTEKS